MLTTTDLTDPVRTDGKPLGQSPFREGKPPINIAFGLIALVVLAVFAATRYGQ
jgi:hypothetical protein